MSTIRRAATVFSGRLPLAILVLMLMAIALPVSADEAVPKQVYFVVEKGKLVASNIRFSRFDTLKLKPQERIAEEAVGAAAIVVVTNSRIIGYGVTGGWRTERRLVGEKIQAVAADDYAGQVITNKRLLNFNGQTGVWAKQTRGVEN